MNAKYALALILALQVSMSLCEIPAPSEDLVQKYNELEKTFMQRLMTAYKKVQNFVAPVVEQIGDSEQAQAAKEYHDHLQTLPHFQALTKVFDQMLKESSTMADSARGTTLGLYEYYLRQHVGDYLSDAIDQAKVYLNKFLPVESVADDSA